MVSVRVVVVEQRAFLRRFQTTPHINPTTSQYLRQEADALVETLGFEVAMSETVRLRKFHPRTYIGRGKLGDLRGIVAALGGWVLDGVSNDGGNDPG